MTKLIQQKRSGESLLINRITARPESVFALVQSLVALSADQLMPIETLREIVAPDLSSELWKENIEAAAVLGAVEVSGESVRATQPQMESDGFKRLVRRRMQEWEQEGSPNGNCFGAMRVALGMPLPNVGLIPFDSFIAEVNGSLGPLVATDTRVFNEAKADSWLRWMRYTNIAVGKGRRFAPFALACFRDVLPRLEIGRDYALREFFIMAEEEVPCTVDPATEVPAGILPPTTVACLSLLETEGTVKLIPIGDAEEWIFQDEQRAVTHLRLPKQESDL